MMAIFFPYRPTSTPTPLRLPLYALPYALSRTPLRLPVYAYPYPYTPTPTPILLPLPPYTLTSTLGVLHPLVHVHPLSGRHCVYLHLGHS